jgi:hypothetical protein
MYETEHLVPAVVQRPLEIRTMPPSDSGEERSACRGS